MLIKLVCSFCLKLKTSNLKLSLSQLPTANCQLLLLILSTLIPALSNAEIREYDIEIIIFEDATAQYIDSEKWPSIALGETEDNIEPESIELSGEPVELSDPEPRVITNSDIYNEIYNEIEGDYFSDQELDYQQEAEYPAENNVINISDLPQTLLTEEAEKLERSSRYKILLHKAWRQTGLEKESMISIPVDSHNANLKQSDINDPLGQMILLEKQESEDVHSNIKGTIKIELARYLHVYTDLVYQKPITRLSPLDHSKIASKNYLIKSHRRMRSKETHYIDHPLIGILVMATPVEVEPDN